MATTHAREPGDDAFAGRHGHGGDAGAAQLDATVARRSTVRRARSRRLRPVASSSRASKASRSPRQRRDVGLGQSCHRAPPSSALCRSSSGAARRSSCRASSATTPAARSRASCTLGAGDDERRRPLGAPGRVVRERLVGAEEAGHQPQRPGAAHHVLAEDVQHTSRRAHVLVDAGAPRRPVDRRRRRVAHGRGNSSSTMLSPLDQ